MTRIQISRFFIARLPILFAAVTVILLAVEAAKAETLYIQAGKLIDVTAGEIRENQAIIVEDERIVSVGQQSDLAVPDGARIIDLGDATVLPGLMDAHVHLTGSHEHHGYRGLGISVPRETVIGVANARRTLLAGFTTVRNLGAAGFSDVALTEGIDEGEIIGPRILPAGRALGITGGHCDSNLLPSEFAHQAGGVADGPWAVRAKVRENIKYGALAIKFCGTGGVLSKGTKLGAQQYTFEEMHAIVDEAHMHGLTVAVHAHGLEGIKTAIRAGVDSVEHSSFIDDEGIAMAIAKGTFLTMDIYVTEFILSEGEEAGILAESLEKERTVGGIQRENFRKAVEAGARITFGTDAGVYPHGTNARQFARMVEFGMTPMQAIQAATKNTAELFRMDADVGALEPGLYADIVAVSGDLLEDISKLENVDFVMKGGEIYVNRIAE